MLSVGSSSILYYCYDILWIMYLANVMCLHQMPELNGYIRHLTFKVNRVRQSILKYTVLKVNPKDVIIMHNILKIKKKIL